MTILVIGTPDSGKSEKAEELAIGLSGKDKRIYLATMMPYGEEGENRVKKHRKQRGGKGFLTVERTRDIAEVVDESGFISGVYVYDENETRSPVMAKDATVLLECVTNLCANEMFDDTEKKECLSGEKACEKIVAGILRLRDEVKNLVIVTNEFEPEESFDDGTLGYIRAVSNINEKLRLIADKTCDITGGTWKIYETH